MSIDVVGLGKVPGEEGRVRCAMDAVTSSWTAGVQRRGPCSKDDLEKDMVRLGRVPWYKGE